MDKKLKEAQRKRDAAAQTLRETLAKNAAEKKRLEEQMQAGRNVEADKAKQDAWRKARRKKLYNNSDHND